MGVIDLINIILLRQHDRLTMKLTHASIGLLLLTLLIALFPLWKTMSQSENVYSDTHQLEHASVAIVFGAGLRDQNTPSDMLDDRLKAASTLYHEGLVDKILVSGDNRFEDYSEPDVMFETLVTTYDVPEDDVFVDYAGRRTYDTCVRAHELWGIENAILVSQNYHLPRAIWTCEKLGVSSVGFSASLQPYLFETQYKQREILATYKAFIDLYIWEPTYIGGEFIQDLDS